VTEERKKKRTVLVAGESQVALMLAKVGSGWVVKSYQKPNS
jgi:hypothetical protein